MEFDDSENRTSASLTAVQEETSYAQDTRGRSELVDNTTMDTSDPTGAAEASAAATLLASVAHGSSGVTFPSSHSISPTLPNPLPVGYNKDLPICQNCSTQTTPLWRRSHDSTQVLCNACALFFKMKGRPRPISLKTDVIKQRNRSKGKSTSKDRLGAGINGVGGIGSGGSKKSRGDSTSRTREEGKGPGKSATGGSEMDDEELDFEGEVIGRKSRKTGAAYSMPAMPGYPATVPPGQYPYPYPYQHPQSHAHQHQPYPPPRDRSRSTSTSRRSHSETRAGYAPGQVRGVQNDPNAPPYPYPPPTPAGYHTGAPPPAEGYYPYYPGYPLYQGHPNQYYPAAAGYNSHPHSLQPPLIKHAQSDSRSRSPSARRSETPNDSPRSSASPPHPSSMPYPPSSYYPPQSSHHPYNHSPLGYHNAQNGTDRVPSSTPGNTLSSRIAAHEEANGRVTLAPIKNGGGPHEAGVASGSESDGGTRGRERVALPSIGSMTPTVVGNASPSTLPPMLHVQRHTALFESRFPRNTDPNHISPIASPRESTTNSTLPPMISPRHSSNSAASNSGSSDGMRSPEVNSAVPLPWSGGRWEDERRGRSERRYEEHSVEDKGKGREFGTLLEGDDEMGGIGSSLGEGGMSMGRMVGVESGFEDLRVADSPHYQNGETNHTSRSRSSGQGREGGRGRGQHRTSGNIGGIGNPRSLSTSGMNYPPARSSSNGSSTGRLSSIDEVARLKTKVAELTFMNNLMKSRLSQLEEPGQASSPEDTLIEEEGSHHYSTEGIPNPHTTRKIKSPEDEELDRYGVTASDPAVRASLLTFFRSQKPVGSS